MARTNTIKNQSLAAAENRVILSNPRSHIMEPDQIDVVALTVLCHLEQIDETQESRLARQFRRDVGKADGLDRIHFDLTFFHTVPGAHSHMETLPDSNTAGDFSAANSLAKPLGECHKEILP
jgi:hypothetical protein